MSRAGIHLLGSLAICVKPSHGTTHKEKGVWPEQNWEIQGFSGSRITIYGGRKVQLEIAFNIEIFCIYTYAFKKKYASVHNRK